MKEREKKGEDVDRQLFWILDADVTVSDNGRISHAGTINVTMVTSSCPRYQRRPFRLQFQQPTSENNNPLQFLPSSP